MVNIFRDQKVWNYLILETMCSNIRNKGQHPSEGNQKSISSQKEISNVVLVFQNKAAKNEWKNNVIALHITFKLSLKDKVIFVYFLSQQILDLRVLFNIDRRDR